MNSLFSDALWGQATQDDHDSVLDHKPSTSGSGSGGSKDDSPGASTKTLLHIFRHVPFLSPNIEYFFLIGALCCFDYFLDCLLTPLRLLVSPFLRGQRIRRTDILAMAFVAVCLAAIHLTGDHRLYATLYHWIRAQSMLKLYVIFNILEATDRLLANICSDCGHLLATVGGSDEKAAADRRQQTTKGVSEGTSSEGEPSNRSRSSAGRDSTVLLSLSVFVIGAIAAGIHTLMILAQVVVLNVALNSDNNGLFALLISNNFTEMKSALWKPFSLEVVFQMLCNDMVERLQFFAFITVMLLQHGESGGVGAVDPLELMIILVFEMGVDFIKHYCICRYNNIPLSVHRLFLQVLLFDVAKERCLAGGPPLRLATAPPSMLNNKLLSTLKNSKGATEINPHYGRPSQGFLPNPLRRVGFLPFPYLGLILWSASGMIRGWARNSEQIVLELSLFVAFLIALKIFCSLLLTGMAMRFLCRTLLLGRGKRAKPPTPTRSRQATSSGSPRGAKKTKKHQSANGKKETGSHQTAVEEGGDSSSSSCRGAPPPIPTTPPPATRSSSLSTSTLTRDDSLPVSPITPTGGNSTRKQLRKLHGKALLSDPAFGQGGRQGESSASTTPLRSTHPNSTGTLRPSQVSSFPTGVGSGSVVLGTSAASSVVFGVSPPADLQSPLVGRNPAKAGSQTHKQQSTKKDQLLGLSAGPDSNSLESGTLLSFSGRGDESSFLEEPAGLHTPTTGYPRANREKTAKTRTEKVISDEKPKLRGGRLAPLELLEQAEEILLLYDPTLAVLNTVSRFLRATG